MYGFTAQWVAHDIPAEMGPTEFIVGSHEGKRPYTNDEALSAISSDSSHEMDQLTVAEQRFRKERPSE